MASPLVHVGGDFCHAASHGTLPHPVRVEQPLWHDTTWQEQAACILLLLRPQSMLRHTVWTHCRHQGKLALVSVINRYYAGWSREKKLQGEREEGMCIMGKNYTNNESKKRGS